MNDAEAEDSHNLLTRNHWIDFVAIFHIFDNQLRASLAKPYCQ